MSVIKTAGTDVTEICLSEEVNHVQVQFITMSFTSIPMP
jgi:hypothetical protein